MKKKNVFKFLLVIVCLIGLVGLISIVLMVSNVQINIKDYELGKSISEDLDNDGKTEEISVVLDGKSENVSIHDPKSFSINIDDKTYNFDTDPGERVISFTVADLNLDNKLEVLVCVYYDMISPSYRKWNVYSLVDNQLVFVEKIFDGQKIEYNRITKMLKVEYLLHETIKPMTETVYYRIKF